MSCFCLSFLAFFSLPLLSILYHLAISVLPSISSFLPFYFFLACTHLAYLSALFLFLLALLPFIDLLFVRSSFESLGSFSTFPCSHLFPQIFLHISAFSLHFSPSPSLTSPPSSLLPRFATFGVFNPHTNTPVLPHLIRTTCMHLLSLLEESTHLRRQELSWGCAHRRRYRGGLYMWWMLGLGRGRGDLSSPGFFQKLKGRRCL